MRLLYLHHVPPHDNMANVVQVLHMCTAFADCGVDVTLAVPGTATPEGDVEAKRRIEEKSGRPTPYTVETFRHFRMGGRMRAAGTWFGARRYLRSRQGVFDVCFCRATVLQNLALRHGHSVMYEAHGETINTKSKILDAFYRNRLVCDSRAGDFKLFIAISQALADVWVEKGIPQEKIVAAHDGFAAEDYATDMPVNDARTAVGLDTGAHDKVVVYTGSLYADRNIEWILELALRHPDTLFVVVGGPETQRDKYEAMGKQGQLGNLRFTGYVPPSRVTTYQFAADILLMLWSWAVPTIHICSPLKAFEYMATGRTIVGQAFPTIKEVLADGEDAFLADPSSVDALDAKLSQALAIDHPNETGARARRRAFEEYTWKRRAESILSAYLHRA